MKTKILFIYRSESTFVKKDLSMLKKYYNLATFCTKNLKRHPTKLFNLVKKIRKCDLIYIWFAGEHAAFSIFFAKMFNKKTMIIVGGCDAANVPEINYGLFSSRMGRFIGKFVYKNADLILPVDESLKNKILLNTKLNISKKIKTVPTGYNSKIYGPKGIKENMVLTVAIIEEKQRIKIKGVDYFLEVAKAMPNIKFVVVGIEQNLMRGLSAEISNNVLLLKQTSVEEVIKQYQKAKVYCQLSRTEGLPNVLCEAMLCECVPIGTNVGGIENAIGDTGFIIEPNVTTIKKAINLAMKLNGENARARIKKLFPEEKREKEITKLISNLVSKI